MVNGTEEAVLSVSAILQLCGNLASPYFGHRKFIIHKARFIHWLAKTDKSATNEKAWHYIVPTFVLFCAYCLSVVRRRPFSSMLTGCVVPLRGD